MTNINIEIPKEVHTKLKATAANKNMTLKAYVNKLLRGNDERD